MDDQYIHIKIPTYSIYPVSILSKTNHLFQIAQIIKMSQYHFMVHVLILYTYFYLPVDIDVQIWMLKSPGKSWKVLDFEKCPGKSLKVLEFFEILRKILE